MEHVDDDERVELIHIVHGLHERRQFFVRAAILDGIHVLDAKQQILKDPQGKRGIKLFLVLEIQIEGPGAEFGLLSDVFHGGFGESPVGKNTFGGDHDLLAPAFFFSFLALLDTHEFLLNSIYK